MEFAFWATPMCRPVTSLGHQRGDSGKGPHFLTMSNSFKPRPTHFFSGTKFLGGFAAPQWPPQLRACICVPLHGRALYVRRKSQYEFRDQTDCPKIVVKHLLPILGNFSLCAWLSLKICPFWARLINVAENCNENRKISCLNLIYFYCRQNYKLEVRFDINLKPTTNDVYWRNFWIFLYIFVHLLRALPTFLFGKLVLFFII